MTAGNLHGVIKLDNFIPQILLYLLT